MTDITELTSVQKNANIHRLSRLIAYAPNDELRQMAVEVEHYTDQLIEALEKAQTINAAAEKLVRCKGRYHSEQNYRALAALFGVKTPDLPPLEHENVHYADAAEMEIAALRQRIAELESRTVKLPKLKMLEDYLAEVAIEERKQILVGVKLEFHRACVAAGIKVEAE